MKNISLSILFGALIGLAIGYKLFSKSKPEILEVTKINTITKTVKVTDTSGKITETTEQNSSNLKESLTNSYKPRYSFGISGLKSVEYVTQEARIGDMPIFLGADISLKSIDQSRLRLRFEF